MHTSCGALAKVLSSPELSNKHKLELSNAGLAGARRSRSGYVVEKGRETVQNIRFRYEVAESKEPVANLKQQITLNPSTR